MEISFNAAVWSRFSSSLSRSAIRCVFILFGSLAVLWGSTTFPVFWRDSAIEATAQQIIRGEQFDFPGLKGEIPGIDAIDRSSYCRPAAIRSAAIIRLRIAEQAMAQDDQPLMNQQLIASDRGIRESLSCSPADPFLWLALFWTDTNLNGFRPDDLQYVRMSYQLGPNEGWIAITRNRLAFAMFDQLPPDLAESALREFVAMINAQMYAQAAAILTGPAWHERQKILSRLNTVPLQNRKIFEDALYARGANVVVPGTELPIGQKPY
jgi:hypothetical protein